MTIERIWIIREIEKTTMSRNIFIIVFGVLLIHCAIGANVVATISCLLTDNQPLLPYYGDCTKYVICYHGKGYKFSCPRGLHWSKALNRCESPSVANCNSNESTAKPLVGGGSNCTFNYRPHTDCSKFIQCVDGQDRILDCAPGTYWDRNNNKCVFDQNVC